MPESIQIKKDYLTILTVREVAEYLRLSQAKVYRLAKERRLPAIRIGKSWRFRKDLLDEWLSRCTESGLDSDGLTSTALKESCDPAISKEEPAMTAQWYVLHSKPMKEAVLREQLDLQRIESYYPCIRTQPVSAHARKMKPYFPGYIFGYVDLERVNLSALQWMPGASGIVSFGGLPSSVSDNIIAAIRRRVDEINLAGGELFHGLKPGDTVTIHDGPFSGYEAIFDARLSGEERVRVFLKLLNRQQFPLELSSRQIQRKKQ